LLASGQSSAPVKSGRQASDFQEKSEATGSPVARKTGKPAMPEMSGDA